MVARRKTPISTTSVPRKYHPPVCLQKIEVRPRYARSCDCAGAPAAAAAPSSPHPPTSTFQADDSRPRRAVVPLPLSGGLAPCLFRSRGISGSRSWIAGRLAARPRLRPCWCRARRMGPMRLRARPQLPLRQGSSRWWLSALLAVRPLEMMRLELHPCCWRMWEGAWRRTDAGSGSARGAARDLSPHCSSLVVNPV